MLAVVAPVEHAAVAVQPVGDRGPVDLHAGREHHQLEPLGHLPTNTAPARAVARF